MVKRFKFSFNNASPSYKSLEAMSVLLPKETSDFSADSYWEKFFKKRDNLPFEWYGDYENLRHLLEKYIKIKDNVLQVGCGSSLLAEQLYDSGFRLLSNIDLNETVINQMKKRNLKLRPELHFEHMDATTLRYENESFNVVLDKGTADALLSSSSKNQLVNSQSEENLKCLNLDTLESFLNEEDLKFLKLFSEADRVLMPSGRFICVTLAQPIVLRKILFYFLKKSSCGFIAKMHHVKVTKAFEMPTFLLVLFKMKPGLKLPPVFELDVSGSSVIKCRDVGQFLREVESFQRLHFLSQKVTSRNLGSRTTAFIDMLGDNEIIRYRCYVLNNPSVKKSSYAVFICPQFIQETDGWLYLTSKGRKQLTCDYIKEFQRVIVVLLNSSVDYGSLDSIKSELSSSVMAFAPSDLTEGRKTPFLSVGEDSFNISPQILSTSVSKTNQSEFSVVQFEHKSKLTRSVVFHKDPFQSQLLKSNVDLSSGKILKNCFCSSLDKLTSLMILSLNLKLDIKSHLFAIHVFGFPNLPLVLFLNNFLKKKCVLSWVQPDATLVEVAQTHFGLKENDENLKSVLASGTTLIKDMAENSKLKVDIIVLSNFDTIESANNDEDLTDSFTSLIQKASKGILATGCVFVQVKLPDGDAEAADYSRTLIRAAKAAFQHVSILKLANWDNLQIMILSKSSLQKLELLDCAVDTKLFAPDEIGKLIACLKFLT